jgi:hypothetical protein
MGDLTPKGHDSLLWLSVGRRRPFQETASAMTVTALMMTA